MNRMDCKNIQKDEKRSSSTAPEKRLDARKPFEAPVVRHESDLVDVTASETHFSQ